LEKVDLTGATDSGEGVLLQNTRFSTSTYTSKPAFILLSGNEAEKMGGIQN
jgi:hypothetical protein